MNLRPHINKEFQVAKPTDDIGLFKEMLLGGKPLVVKDSDAFKGIVTAKDLMFNPDKNLESIIRPMPMLQADEGSLSALLFMVNNSYEYLPVFQEGGFLGIVSQKMLLLNFMEKYQENSLRDGVSESILDLKKELTLKNKFLALLGHDIKNLFMQVLGSLDLLDSRLRNLDDIKIQSVLHLAKKSAEQVHNAFDGMLLWAQLSTGQLPFRPEQLLLGEQIAKIIEQFHLAGNVKNIAIRGEAEDGDEVYADPNMLGCILMNLVYNAIKFTPSGGEILIRGTQHEGFTEITVQDNGVGMTQQQKSQIFKGSLHTLGTQEETGSGIGLIICKDFVEKHGGTISLDSNTGSGTRVLLRFPHIHEAMNSDVLTGQSKRQST